MNTIIAALSARRLSFCILLAGALLYVVFRQDHRASAREQNDPVVARGPEATAQPMGMGKGASENAAPALTPVQLSPQRLQAIGVTTAISQGTDRQ